MEEPESWSVASSFVSVVTLPCPSKRVFGTNEFLYMIPGFSRQIILEMPEILTIAFFNGTVNIACTSIICGNDQ